MRLLPRLRLLLARRPWLYWLAVGVCAAAIWVSMSAAERSVARERSQWGTTQRVWVTDEAVATGEPIVASARDLPLAMLPAAAVTAPPTGVAAHPLAEGEVVVATDDARIAEALAPLDVAVCMTRFYICRFSRISRTPDL